MIWADHALGQDFPFSLINGLLHTTSFIVPQYAAKSKHFQLLIRPALVSK